ncbi:MAG: signal peptidase I, partial [Candidatus Pararuminococcus gallinarum]
MQKALRYVGKGAQILITVLLVLLLICNLYLITMNRILGVEHPTILGYSTAVVASGSMEPALSVDDLILNHVQTSYEEGDIITFQSGGSLTTHRIVSVTNEGYITRGDANNTYDQNVTPPEAVIGRVVGVIPRVGSVL